MTVVIGTAGHIDHGKTTLLRALTGMDADRLPEEQARGMTIDVGYAHVTLEDGTELDFVDVPGHDRLVGNMLVGAGEIDAALIVVAADDGPRAQTLEHLEILDALGVSDGVVAITKADLADPDGLTAVEGAVRALVDRTTLRGAAVVPVSAANGAGVDELRAALVEIRDRVARRPHDDPGDLDDNTGVPTTPDARLAIDRVFSIRGRGTVVTGTLRGGDVSCGASLRVVPGPRGASVRVREVQVHGRTVETAGPGRVALNVAVGGDTISLERGHVLTSGSGILASDRILVTLGPVANLAAPLGQGGGTLPPDRAKVLVHVGTTHANGTVSRTGRDAVALGDEATAVLRLDEPVAVAPGDRFVVRRPSPAATLAGGRVLDPEPPRGVARRRATRERIAALAAAPPSSPAWRAARLELHGVVVGAAVEAAPGVIDAIDEAIVDAATNDDTRTAELIEAGRRTVRRLVGPIDAAGSGQPRSSATSPVSRLVAARIEALAAAGTIVRDGDRFRLPGRAAAAPTPELLAAMDRLVAALSVVAPPPLREAARAAGCPDAGIRLLEASNRIVRLDDDLAWSASAYADLTERALEMAAREPLTPAAFRDATGTSRKYVMVVLEDLGRRAILARTPAGHVPGSRAAVRVR